MDRNFTLLDLQHYLREVNRLACSAQVRHKTCSGPSNNTLVNLLRYSSALEMFHTTSAGTTFHLSN